jgi:membrane protein
MIGMVLLARRNMSKVSDYWKVVKKAALDFNDDNGFKLSASLSYSTIFAVGPLLILVISLLGIFLGRQAVEGRIYEQIKDLVGGSAAMQIQDIIKNIRHSNHTVTGAVVGGIVLLLAATGVFTEIQGSINYIWCILTKPKKSWLKFLQDRLLSFSLIIALGFISLVSLIVTSLVDVLGGHLKAYFSNVTVYAFYSVNFLLTLVVIVFLFTIIFRILPDAIIRWKDALAGAIFTGVFFVIGKFLIGVYLGNSNIGVTYGAVTSLIVILTWVYYSSIILYLGAEFTKGYASKFGDAIKPSDTAVMIRKEEMKPKPIEA